MNRRHFLGLMAAGTTVFGRVTAIGAGEPPLAPPEQRKLILVLFGGGTRSSETIDDLRHRHIPQLWNDLIPRGTLWTNMRVEGRVVHPNSNASIKTGHWEYDGLDWSRPPAHPTIFEIVRKQRGLPDTGAWTFDSFLTDCAIACMKRFSPHAHQRRLRRDRLRPLRRLVPLRGGDPPHRYTRLATLAERAVPFRVPGPHPDAGAPRPRPAT